MRCHRLIPVTLCVFALLSGCTRINVTTRTQVEETQPSDSFAAPRTPSGVDYSVERYRLVNQPDEIVSVLKNGLTVIVRRVNTPVVSVQAHVRTGSIFEKKWLGGGLSHLLEHLVAGGSCDRRTEQQNRDLLQAIGDNSNAYTDYDHTVFFVNTTPAHVEQAVDLVTGWVFGAKITPAEYKREYQVVQRELEKDLGEADRAFEELAMDTRYIYSPYRIPVIGYQAVIQGLSRDDVYAYYLSAYVPQNIIVGVAGNMDPEAMLTAVRSNVKDVAPGRMPDKAIPQEPPVQQPRTAIATFPKLGQAKLEIGFPSVTASSQEMYAMDLLSMILGGSESSILVQDLRDQQHLVSKITSYDNTPFYVDGTFAVDCDLDASKLKEATDAILADVEKLKTEPIPADRIERAKTLVRTQTAMNLQTAENNVAAMINNYLVTGSPDESYADRIAAVTPEQLQAAAKKYLDKTKLLTTVLLPEGAYDFPSAATLLRKTSPTTTPAGQAIATTGEAAEVKKIDLGNGTTLLLKRVSQSPVVSIQMYARGGLSAEDAKSNGLGNLAMETLIRGTESRSADQLAVFFDSIGGSFDGACGNNTWAWSATCLKDKFPQTLEVFADLVRNPKFAADELKGIQEQTLAAIDDQDRDWYGAGKRYFNSVFFGPQKSPYQFTILGTKENVQGFTAEQVKRWYNDHVLKGQRVLAIYGDIDLAEAEKLANHEFMRLPQPDRVVPDATRSTPREVSQPSIDVTKVDVNHYDNPQAAVFIGFNSNSYVGDPANDAITMAKTLCSGFSYPTGYIFETLRGEGLVYDANTQNFMGRSNHLPGAFWAYAVCDPKNVDAVIDGILLNIARMQGSDKDMDPDWFARAKNMAILTAAMDAETTASQAQIAALDELWGLGFDYYKSFPKRLQAVTMDQVRQVARTRLSQCVIAVSTPNPDLMKTNAGVRTYNEFPKVDLTPQGVQHDTK